jgi:hypothetical protein
MVIPAVPACARSLAGVVMHGLADGAVMPCFSRMGMAALPGTQMVGGSVPSRMPAVSPDRAAASGR